MKTTSNIVKIPGWVLCVRTLSELILRPLMPRVIFDHNQALEKVHDAGRRGKGLVIVYTHFSFRDAMEANRIVITDPVLKNREVVNPLAFHQSNKALEVIGKIFHGTLVPIVNNSTLAKKGFEHLPKGRGLHEFIAAGGNALAKGGVIPLAVNATRSEKLNIDDQQKPLGYLIASLQSKSIKNYGLLLAGFAVRNAKNYTKKEVGGFNAGKTYILNLADYYSLEELLNKPEVKGKVGLVDAFVRRELAKISPKEYIP